MEIEVKMHGRRQLIEPLKALINKRRGILKSGERSFEVTDEGMGTYIVHGNLEKTEDKIVFKVSRCDVKAGENPNEGDSEDAADGQ